MPERKGFDPSYFDVPYGIASAALTAGLNAVATTGGYYHGCVIQASAADCTAIVYDSASATAGNRLDMVMVDSDIGGLFARSDLRNPVKAKNGITVGVSEAGAVGVCFYGPKG